MPAPIAAGPGIIDDTSMTITLAIILLAYLAGLFALSLYANRRVQGEEDYLVAGRRLPLWLAWGTLLATWFGAATILGAAEAARDEGLRGTVLDPFASGLALIIAGLFFARPLWEMKLLTLADFYGRRFGPRTEVLGSLIMVPGYFGWIAAQYVALADVQETFFHIPPTAGMLIAAAVVLLYTLIGGMWSVTLTDTLQMGVVLVTLLILAAATLAELGGGSPAAGAARLAAETPPDRFSLLPAELSAAASVAWLGTWMSGSLGNVPGQDLMQRVFASKSAGTARWACVIAGVVYIGFGLLPVSMGLASNLLTPTADGGSILAVLARQYLHPALAAVFVVALVSIIVSTCTSAVLSPAAVLGHNLLGRLPMLKSKGLLTDRAAVLIVTAAGLVCAYSGKSIFELLELSISISAVSLLAPLVMGIYGRPRGELPAILAMLAGAAVWLPREALELAILPAPDDYAGHYADYVYSVLTRTRWHAAAAYGVYLFAVVPSVISGTAVSFAAYFAGQVLRPKALQ